MKFALLIAILAASIFSSCRTPYVKAAVTIAKYVKTDKPNWNLYYGDKNIFYTRQYNGNFIIVIMPVGMRGGEFQVKRITLVAIDVKPDHDTNIVTMTTDDGIQYVVKIDGNPTTGQIFYAWTPK